MEFLTPKQKKDKARRLWFGYFLFSILISLAAYIMVSTALGYEIFSAKGEVVQNGLLFVNSTPSGAEVYLNGQRESDNTNAKYSLPENRYSVVLRRPGYREWRNEVDLFGGRVKFLTYPRLYPEQPAVLGSKTFSSLPMTTKQSRDQRWLVVHSQANSNEWQIFDLENPTSSQMAVSVPAAILGDKTISSVEITEWAGDNTHFLANLSLSDQSRKVVLINRSKPAESVDLTGVFNLQPSDKVYLWDGKWDKYIFVNAEGVARQADLGDRSVNASALIADPIQQFFPIGNARAVYTTKQSDGTFLVKFYQKEKTYVITTYGDTTNKIDVKAAGFNRNDYLMISGGGLDKPLLYRNFIDGFSKSLSGRAAPFVTMPLSNANNIEFSRSNRFALSSDGNEAVVFDIEQRETKRFELPVQDPAKIGWLDDSRLYAIGQDNSLKIFDYDGANVYDIAGNVIVRPFVDGRVENLAYVSLDEAKTQTFNFINILNASNN